MNDGLSIFKQERPEKTDKHENLYLNAVWLKREKKKIVKSAKRQKKCDENLMSWWSTHTVYNVTRATLKLLYQYIDLLRR